MKFDIVAVATLVVDGQTIPAGAHRVETRIHEAINYLVDKVVAQDELSVVDQQRLQLVDAQIRIVEIAGAEYFELV